MGFSPPSPCFSCFNARTGVGHQARLTLSRAVTPLRIHRLKRLPAATLAAATRPCRNRLARNPSPGSSSGAGGGSGASSRAASCARTRQPPALTPLSSSTSQGGSEGLRAAAPAQHLVHKTQPPRAVGHKHRSLLRARPRSEPPRRGPASPFAPLPRHRTPPARLGALGSTAPRSATRDCPSR